MPTVIDQLVVTLGLDTKAYKQGQVEAVRGLNVVRQESNRTAKDMEASGKRAAQFYSQIKTEVLGLIGVLVGAKGLESMVAGTTNSLASLGREARNIGISGRELKAFTNVIEQNGGKAEAATQSLAGLAQQIQNFKTFGDPSILKWLNPIGADVNESPIGIFMKFMRFAEEHRNNPVFVSQVGRGLGFDQGTINAVEQIKSLSEYQREYNQALKDAPTQQQIDDATELQKQWIALEQAGKSLAQTITSDLTPALISLTQHTHDWVEANKQLVSDTVTGGIQHLGEDLKFVADNLHDWKSTGEVVAAYFAGPFAIAVLAGLSPITAAIAAIVAGLALIDKSRRGDDLATLSPGSPLWANVPESEQTNYVNSPRSQAFLHPGNPNPFSPFNPGSWMGRKPSAFQQAQRSSNQDAITRFFLSKGYTPEQVAGILANVESESGFDPTKVSADGGHGLFQWTSQERLNAFKARYGVMPEQASLSQQLEFAQWELTHTEARAGAALRSANTKYAAGSVFSLDFERPFGGFLTGEQRGLLAEQYNPRPVASSSASAGSKTDVNIQNLNVYTKATDAHGIARDINGAITTQANRGLQ